MQIFVWLLYIHQYVRLCIYFLLQMVLIAVIIFSELHDYRMVKTHNWMKSAELFTSADRKLFKIKLEAS